RDGVQLASVPSGAWVSHRSPHRPPPPRARRSASGHPHLSPRSALERRPSPRRSGARPETAMTVGANPLTNPPLCRAGRHRTPVLESALTHRLLEVEHPRPVGRDVSVALARRV